MLLPLTGILFFYLSDCCFVFIHLGTGKIMDELFLFPSVSELYFGLIWIR